MVTLGTHTETEEIGSGKFRTTIHMRQCNVVKGGVWTRATDRIVASGVADLSMGCDEIATLRLCPSIDNLKLARSVPLIHWGAGKNFVEFTPLGLRNSVGVPIGDSGWLYRDAWPNADYSILNGGHILRDPITLRKGHPASFSFRIDAQAGFEPKTMKFGDDFRILNPTLERGEEIKRLIWDVQNVSGKYILTVVVPVGDWAGWTVDPTLTLQPDPGDGIDTYLMGQAIGTPPNPQRNFGVTGTLSLRGTDPTKALLRLNCSTIPGTATCTAATFYGYKAGTGTANAFVISAYSIALGNTAWIEGTKSNTLAGAGEPCWNALAADGAGGVTTPWAGSVGLGTAITDYEAALLGSFSGNRTAADGTEYSTTLTAARIQGWFGAINTNYGLLLIPSGNMDGIYSSDYGTAGLRPKFVVDYTVPAGLRVFSNPFQSPFSGGFA